ncbi:MAG: hypothetical protein P4M11_03995 [Candidatus Pacebacteria bacterium]|nr:hypothetical protein [Candidatus Paceibacterota bacterium]
MHALTYNSPEVVHILHDTDEQIEDYIHLISNDTLLITFGDHGSIIKEGTHGGGSKEEIESALFTYTKKGFSFHQFKDPRNLSPKTRELLHLANERVPDLVPFLNRDYYQQYDIVPTMASMFNVPIPFTSIGVVIPELMHYPVGQANFVSGNLYELLLDHVINYLQFYTYYKYTKKGGIMSNQYKKIKKFHASIKPRVVALLKQYHSAAQFERKFVTGNSSRRLEQEAAQYLSFVENCFSVMRDTRYVLTDLQQQFVNQWCTVKNFYLYSSWGIRVLVTVSLALTVFIFGFVISQSAYQALAGSAKSYIAVLVMQLIVLAVVAVFPSLSWAAVYAVFLAVLGIIATQCYTIYRNIGDVKSFIVGSSIPSVVAVGLLYTFHFIACTMDTINNPGTF